MCGPIKSLVSVDAHPSHREQETAARAFTTSRYVRASSADLQQQLKAFETHRAKRSTASAATGTQDSHTVRTRFAHDAFTITARSSFSTWGWASIVEGHTEANGVMNFQWEGWSTAGPWGATGTVNGNSLTVQYNAVMEWSDFEDAVYALMH